MSNFKENTSESSFGFGNTKERSSNFVDRGFFGTRSDNFSNSQNQNKNQRNDENTNQNYQQPYYNDENDFKSSRSDRFETENNDSGFNKGSGEFREGTKSTRSGIKGHEPEMRYFHMFNLKREPYRLKHYMYYSNDLNLDFHVENYNKLGVKVGKPPQINHYMRYYEMKFDNELDPKGKHYGSFYTLTEDNQSQNVIHNREYRGYYSRQLDYVNYKLAMSQEKQSSGK